MSAPTQISAETELKAASGQTNGLLRSAFVFSVFVNLLALTGPLFMLLIYDRVLASRSEETLVALTLLLTLLFVLYGGLDFVRGRVLARKGWSVQVALQERALNAGLLANQDGRPSAAPLQGLDAMTRFATSPVAVALFDLPWTPFFLFAIALFHPALGLLAVGAGAIMVVITLLAQARTRGLEGEVNMRRGEAEALVQQMLAERDTLRPLGLHQNVFARWATERLCTIETGIAFSDRAAALSTFSKTFRLYLQSAMLALGAYLVLQDAMSAGAMIAASILLGRALAPIEMVIAQWPVIQSAMTGRTMLLRAMAQTPIPPQTTKLPRPDAKLDVQQLTVFAGKADRATLRLLSFEVLPGQCLGVIGPSGGGKSTLARTLTGSLPISAGAITLGGAALSQYAHEDLADHIGYLPQRVPIFDGTIAENIARMRPDPETALVIQAAQKAGAHQMILGLPKGYDTRVTSAGLGLSGGQIQRIGLARALFSSPVLLLLDEPNANLDAVGNAALNDAIRAQKAAGRITIIMAHRIAALAECDEILVLEQGAKRALGSKDVVLAGIQGEANVVRPLNNIGAVS
jgi:PrtD family type I secretion system ABC transporter